MRKWFDTVARGAPLCGSSLHDSEEWKALRATWKSKLDELLDSGTRGAWRALRDYGSLGPNREQGSYSTLLRPAGMVRGIWMGSGERHVAVWVRQLEIARYGFPNLYEAWAAVLHDEPHEWWNITETIPAQSEDEALSRLTDALQSDTANEVAANLHGDIRVKLFGVAAHPTCLERSLIRVAPTQTDLLRACNEIEDAVSALQKTLERWEGTDALGFLQTARGSREFGFRWRALGDPQSALDGLSMIKNSFAPLESRVGRRMKGGRESVVAYTLASLWTRCGLGQPKLSPQSRFIRACAVVLPWHGVHKADVSQFMRGELGKRRQSGVLIG